MIWRRMILPLCLCVQGCASVPQQDRVEQVEIGESILLTLPTAEQMIESLDATQILTATYDGQTYNMQVQLEWRPGSIVLAALSSFGTTLFSISYDGDRFESRGSRLVMRRLRPEYILADILLTFWDAERLDSQLQGVGLEVSEDDGRRVLSRDGAPVIVISYEGADPWQGPVRFNHVERGYVLDILTVGLTRS